MASRITFPLETPRLLVRPLVLADAEDLFEAYGDADAMVHLTPDVPRDLAGAQEWARAKIELFERDGGLSLWAVVERATGRVIGDCGLQHEDYGWGPEVGLGGRGNRRFWGQGYALEASSACLRAGFDQLGLDRIGAETAPANLPAQRLLRRLGMKLVGTNREGWPVYLAERATWRPPQVTEPDPSDRTPPE